MKTAIIVLILCLTTPCMAGQTAKTMHLGPPGESIQIPVQTPDREMFPPKVPAKPLFGKLFSNVKISKVSFNPSLGQEMTISFILSKSARVTLNIYDPDHGLVRTLSEDKHLEPGKQVFVWDGKDWEGRVVPDEAYFFTIQAKDKSGATEFYDPASFSGGAGHDILHADIDPQTKDIRYRVPEMGRVLIRMGIRGGPLMNTLVDWKPRVKGMITEYWNGKDEDNIIDLYRHPRFKMIITYFTLPHNSIIGFGNRSMDYREYKRSLAAKRPLKTKRARSVPRLSPHYQLPRTEDYAPALKLAFDPIQGIDREGLPILKGRTLVKVELNEEDRAVFQNQSFEICFFLDYEFHAEDEAGYTPFNWLWDLSKVKEGEHLLTVNISGFKDQIGVLSRKVRVVK